MAVKVIALDATQEEQRQIMAELDILHKVCPTSHLFLLLHPLSFLLSILFFFPFSPSPSLPLSLLYTTNAFSPSLSSSLLLSPHSVILATSLAFTVPSSPKTGINHHLLTDPSTMSGDDFVLIYKPFSDVIVIK